MSEVPVCPYCFNPILEANQEVRNDGIYTSWKYKDHNCKEAQKALAEFKK